MNPLLLIAAASPSPGAPPEIDPERVTPGLLGALTFLVLVAAVVLLWRSMNKQMKKVPPSFDDPLADPGSDPDLARPDGAGGTGGTGRPATADDGRPRGPAGRHRRG